MNDLLSELFVELLRLVEISVGGENQRTQALALFAFCGLFGVIVGSLSSGLTATVWFVVAGVCAVVFLLVMCWPTE